MPEATKTRVYANRKIRELFRNYPLLRMTKGDIRRRCGLPPDTEITARIREIRNDRRRPMDIPCERRKVGAKIVYEYLYYPDVPEQLPLSTEKS